MTSNRDFQMMQYVGAVLKETDASSLELILQLRKKFPTATDADIGRAIELWNLTADVQVRIGLRDVKPGGSA